MSLSNNDRNIYRPLAAFLGQILSDDYSVGLYERAEKELGTGASASSILLYCSEPIALDDTSFEKAIEAAKELPFDYLCGFTDRGKMPQIEKAAVYPIRDEKGEMAGFLLIVKKFSEKVDLKAVMENLMMTEDAAEKTAAGKTGEVKAEASGKGEDSSMDARIRQVIREKTEAIYEPYRQKSRLKKADKVDLMRELFEAGITKLRGGMQIIADVTGISQASLYRYLMEVIEE